MSHPEIQLSAAERRLLRKTFRRHAAPYLVVAAGIVLWALSWGRIETEAEPPPEGSETETVVVADPAFQRLVSEVERSQAELRQLAKRSESPQPKAPDSEVPQKLAAIEERATHAERRLREFEAKLGAAKAQGGATPTEIAGIQDRLQRIERRQDQVERASTAADADGATTQRSLLDRLQNLESRLTIVEGADSASP